MIVVDATEDSYTFISKCPALSNNRILSKLSEHLRYKFPVTFRLHQNGMHRKHQGGKKEVKNG